MRRQPLHESHGGSVMTRRPRRRAQISRCYHQLPPPPPPPPTPHSTSPTSPLLEDQAFLLSPQQDSFTTSRTAQSRQSSCNTGHPVTGSYTNRLATGASHSCQATKTSIFGRPFELSNGLTQVGKVPLWNLLLLFIVLSVLARSAMGKEWIEEQGTEVIFRSVICQPLSPAALRRQMGASYDDNRMAVDEESARFLKTKGIDGYQSDGPALNGVDSSGVVETDMYLQERETMYSGNNRIEEREELDIDFDVNSEGVEEREEVEEEVVKVEDGSLDIEKKTILDRRSWLPRRRILKSHTKEGSRSPPSVYKDFQSSENENVGRKDHHVVSDSFKYMRRRRRRRSSEAVGAPGNSKSASGESDRIEKKSSTKKSNHKVSALRLAMTGKLRKRWNIKKLRKQFRKQVRKQNKPPPWQCVFEHRFVVMDRNIFPKLVASGKCATAKCFYRLYKCEPIKYAVKLLQKDTERCNPLPMVGNTTVYEEKWDIITKYVNVGCNCASLFTKPTDKR